MLAIKLKRTGKKKQASFRVVVAEKRSKLRGRFVEDLGFYNPHAKEFKVDGERVRYWLKQGAQPTGTAHNLLVGEKIIGGDKMRAHSTRKRKKQQERVAASAAAEAEKAKAEEAVDKEVVQEQVLTAEADGETSKEEAMATGKKNSQEDEG